LCLGPLCIGKNSDGSYYVSGTVLLVSLELGIHPESYDFGTKVSFGGGGKFGIGPATAEIGGGVYLEGHTSKGLQLGGFGKARVGVKGSGGDLGIGTERNVGYKLINL